MLHNFSIIPEPMINRAFDKLLCDVKNCTICAAHLPRGPRPVIWGHRTARIMIIGQAPGTKVHESGIPWNDASGRRLRDWLNLDQETFYDQSRIAIIPMGFCYPGVNPKGGDNPPRPECAPSWHPALRRMLNRVELTLLVGHYAQRWYLKDRMKKTMTETVNSYEEFLPEFLPIPHPSWRTNHWLKQNPWFESDVIPQLQYRVHALLIEEPC